MWIASAWLGLPVVAQAVNGNMPRTPALYPEHACLTVVDRSVDPTLHFAVHIPFEDTMITEDELPDSRRFSFYGLCRDPGRLEVLPTWISADDTQRALDAEIIDTLPPVDDVLLDDPAWAVGHDGADTCVQSIVAERVQISCEATQDGVTWDTRAAPVGNYVIRGYTFAPPSNLWTTRTGVVQIHDGEPLPVAALVSPTYDAQAFEQDGYRVLGCMGGPPGTTVALQWASTASDALADDAAWTTFAELDAAEGVIDVELALTPDTVYLGLLLRAVATGPDGARWIGQAPGFVTVYPGDGESDAPEVPSPPDHCEAGGESSGGLDSGSTGDGATAGGGADESDAGAGCGCASGPPRPGVTLLAAPLLLARRRRSGPRRRARASSEASARGPDVSQHQDPVQLRSAGDRR